MPPVIDILGLRKEYRSLRGGPTVALDGLDLTVDGPGVYGLLGPNGSGKTTAIRCMLGLVRPSSGAVRVLGADIAGLASVAHRVGALVEGPKFSPNASGRRNLESFAEMSGLHRARVHEVLELVELTARADDPVSAYSLGMSQRLGIAAAMLNDPELVILDEPTNGLDPAGMADVRRFVRNLANEGRTVVVSSHQLHEVQQICDRVFIFRAGRAIASGTVDEIIGGAAERRIIIAIDQRDEAIEVLTGAGFAALPGLDARQLIVQFDHDARASDLNRLLCGAGLYADHIAADTITLEDAFLSLTHDPTGAAATTKVHS